MTSSSFEDRLLGSLQEDANFIHATAGVILATIVLGGSYYSYSLQKKRPWPFVPGWIPLLGHMHQVGSIRNMATKFEEWADKYGSETGVYEMDLTGDKFITVCREDTAMELLKLRPFVLQRQLKEREALNSIGGTGLFAAEQDQWKMEHKLVRPALNHSNVQEYLDVMSQMADRLVKKWSDQCDETTTTATTFVRNIQVDLGNIAADSISVTTLDQDFDFLNHPESREAQDVQKLMGAFILRAFSPFAYWRVPVIGQYLDGTGFAIDRVSKMMNQVIRNYERDHASSSGSSNGDGKGNGEESKDASSGSSSKKTFLSKLYDVMHSEKTKLSHERVIGNIVTLFLAGTDTTSKTLAFALYLFARDTELQKQLQTEVAGVDLKTATLQDLFERLPRLKSFLHEVHRMYGVPFIALQADREVTFCGTKLPKGTNFMLLMKYIGNQKGAPSKDVPLGPNGEVPSEFCSTRYLVKDPDTGHLSTLTPSTKAGGFMVFGHGMRSCPGRTYSEAFSYLLLASLLQTFNVELAPNHPEPKMEFDIVMVPDCGVSLQLTKRAVASK
jgi:cytochrome P450